MTSSYGSANAPARAGSSPDKHAWAWEERGGLRHLSIEFGMTVGKQFVALSMILVQIYYSRNLMMSCDSRRTGMPVAVMCEYTKAYVRCFPLLAFMVSLIVASRMLLCQCMYYKMLKKATILDFQAIHPGKDVLFLFLIWSACNAFLHFVLELSQKHPLSAEMLRKLFLRSETALLEELHKMASLYVLPSLVFLAFLWQAYDLEARLLPLNKYFDEDPDQTKRLLSKLHLVSENVAASLVKTALGSEGTALTSDEVFTRFVEQCKHHELALTENHPRGLIDGSGDEVLEHFSHVHLISEMWPGRLLLDHRLTDESSTNFRSYWFACCALAIVITCGVLGFLIEQLVGDVKDVREGQVSDIAGFFVTLAHAMVILYVGPAFLRNAILPYVKSWKK